MWTKAWLRVVRLCFPYTSGFFFHPNFEWHAANEAGWLVWAFTWLRLPCLASLIISVGKFYVWTSAIMTIDGRISSGTNINTTGCVLATVHNVLLGEFRIIINVNHKHEELRTKTLTHRCTNQQLMLTLWDLVALLLLIPSSHPFVTHIGEKRSSSRDLKTLPENAVWHPHPSIPFNSFTNLGSTHHTLYPMKCFLGIYRWLKAWCVLTLQFIEKK